MNENQCPDYWPEPIIIDVETNEDADFTVGPVNVDWISEDGSFLWDYFDMRDETARRLAAAYNAAAGLGTNPLATIKRPIKDIFGAVLAMLERHYKNVKADWRTAEPEDVDDIENYMVKIILLEKEISTLLGTEPFSEEE